MELNAISTLKRLGPRLGVSVDDFVVGETLTIGGWPALTERVIYFRRAKLASGRIVAWKEPRIVSRVDER